MKKIFSVLFAIITILGCGGCDNSANDSDQTIEDIKEYYTSLSVADVEPSAQYSFLTELEEYKGLYPESKGRTFYVSSKGSDANDGLNESTPFKSLSRVNSIDFQPGDSILFKRGEAFSGELNITVDGADDNPITFGVYGEGEKRPILTNRGTVIRFENSSNLVIRDLEIVVTGEEDSAGRMAIYGRYTTVANDAEKYKNIYIHNNVCYSGSYNSNTYGIYIVGHHNNSDFSTCPNGVISNLYVYDNKVFNVGQLGLVTYMSIAGTSGGNGAKRDYFSNVHYDNNVTYNVGYIGMFLCGVKGGSLNRNLVYSTGMSETGVKSYGDCGLMAISCEDVDIMYNITYDNRFACFQNDAMGIDIDWNTININVQYNYCYSSLGCGIGTMACKDSYIRNNKVVDNECQSPTQRSQIEIGDFVSSNKNVPADLKAITNLKVTDNLIIYTAPADDRAFFSTRGSNGDPVWTGNVFEGNHCVLPNKNIDTRYYWIDIAADRPWYKFANNKYYGYDEQFNAFDETAKKDINEEASVYNYLDKTFAGWQKRDIGSTYQKPTYSRPWAPEVDVSYENDKLKFIITQNDVVWHYNVYSVGEDEEISYRNMLFETNDTFEFEPRYKGTYYIVIEAESNTGVTGRPVKIKVELK